MGANTQINSAIFNLMSRGLVTSATILANGPALQDAIRQIGDYRACSFGVHLNLTQYRPLTEAEAFNEIVDKNGDFSGNLQNVHLTPALRKAIFEEWCAQIEKLESYGVRISHIDSHEHVHTIPHLFAILKLTQRRFRIHRVRITKNIYSYDLPIESNMLLLKKKIWNFALRNYYRTTTASAFTEFSTFLKVAKDLQLSHGTVELMVHPGYPHAADEVAHLQSPWHIGLPFIVHLINYNML